MQTSDTVYRTQSVEHKLLITLHITCINLNEEVVITTGIVTLRYLIYTLNNIHELLNQLLCMLLQTDVTQHHDAIPHPM